ncbi:hypothetical protein Cfor_05344, partial [Coptotermes formosanus]
VSCAVDGRSKTSSSTKENYYGGGGSYYENHKRASDETDLRSASVPTGKAAGGGLGAWGYMAIILTLIGVGVGIYYFTLFYPIVCKKERKYDVMELSSV